MASIRHVCCRLVHPELRFDVPTRNGISGEAGFMGTPHSCLKLDPLCYHPVCSSPPFYHIQNRRGPTCEMTCRTNTWIWLAPDFNFAGTINKFDEMRLGWKHQPEQMGPRFDGAWPSANVGWRSIRPVDARNQQGRFRLEQHQAKRWVNSHNETTTKDCADGAVFENAHSDQPHWWKPPCVFVLTLSATRLDTEALNWWYTY